MRCCTEWPLRTLAPDFDELSRVVLRGEGRVRGCGTGVSPVIRAKPTGGTPVPRLARSSPHPLSPEYRGEGECAGGRWWASTPTLRGAGRFSEKGKCEDSGADHPDARGRRRSAL